MTGIQKMPLVWAFLCVSFLAGACGCVSPYNLYPSLTENDRIYFVQGTGGAFHWGDIQLRDSLRKAACPAKVVFHHWHKGQMPGPHRMDMPAFWGEQNEAFTFRPDGPYVRYVVASLICRCCPGIRRRIDCAGMAGRRDAPLVARAKRAEALDDEHQGMDGLD